MSYSIDYNENYAIMIDGTSSLSLIEHEIQYYVEVNK